MAQPPPPARKADAVALAAAHIEKSEFDKAEAILRRAVFQTPKDAAAYGALCHALEQNAKVADMEFFARQGLKALPGHPGLTAVLGRALRTLRRNDEAKRLLEDALMRSPGSLEIAMELAEVLVEINHWIEAIELADRAIKEGWAADPLLRMRATVMHKLGRLTEAVAFVRGAQWRDGPGVDPAHAVATMLNYDAGSTAAQVAAAHRRYGMLLSDHFGAERRRHPRCEGPDRPLRIGILSPDLRTHSVAYFAAPMFSALRAGGHTVIAYSSAYNVDEWTRVFMDRAHVFRRVAGMSLAAIADLMAADLIDVLFELSGLTTGNAVQLLAVKPAPVVVSYIGYPSTTGIDAIDYRLVDALTDPIAPHYDALAVERLVRMEGCFLCYEPAMQHMPPVREGGPPADRPFTFGSFNALHKVNDYTLRLWGQVLAEAPGSRLAVKMARSGSARTTDAIVDRFVQAGIARERVEWMPHTPGQREHLATYDGIDLSLDTFPYHGTTTTLEAMLMGVPVVSLIGDRHSARVGLSLLSAVGLADLAVGSEDAFVRVATGLACDHERLAQLRSALRARVMSAVGDVADYARRLNHAVRCMWQEACKR